MKKILTIFAALACAVGAHGQASFLGGKAAVTSLHAQTNYFIVVIGGGTNSPIRSLSPSNALEILKGLPNWPVTGTNLTTLAAGSATLGSLTGSNGVAFGATGRYVWKADTGLGYLYDNVEGSAAISVDDTTSLVSINPSLSVVRSVTIGETNFVNVIKFVGGQVEGTGLLGTDGSTNAVTIGLGAGLARSGNTLYATALTNNDTRAIVLTGGLTASVNFADTDGVWTATTLGAALEEINDSINAGSPNGTGAKVHWSQLLGVPAGFADNTDDGAGGGGISQTNANQFGAATVLTIKDGVRLTNAVLEGTTEILNSGNLLLSTTGLTPNRALYINAGRTLSTASTVDSTELGYLDGVTSAIQTQLDAKLSSTTNGNQFAGGSTLTIKDGALVTNVQARGITALGLTTSRATFIDGNGNLTNVTSGSPSTEYVKADGTTGTPSGSGTPGGNSGAIQFTEGSGFAGTNDFLFDRTNKLLKIAVSGSSTGLGKLSAEWPGLGTNYFGGVSVIGTNVGAQAAIFGVTIGGVHNGIQVGTNNVSPAGNTLSNHTDLGRVDLPWRNVYAENFNARQGLVMGTNGAATLTMRAPLMALDATNVIETRIRIPVARQARVFYSVTGSGGVNTIIETNDYVAFTNGNTSIASGSLMASNVFQWGVTNMGTNGSITVDWNGPRYGRAQLNGDTTFSFTNPPALGTPGRSFTLEIAHVGVSSAVTIQTIGPVGINWQSGTVILQNFTNKLYVEWNGTNFIGSSAQDTTSGSGAAALTNAPVLFNTTLNGATTLATTTNQQAQHFLVETRLIPTNNALSNIVVNFAQTNTVELWVTNNMTFTNWTGISDSGSVPLLYLIRPQLIPRGVNWGNLGLSNPGYGVAIATNGNNLLWTTLTNGKTYALTLTRVRTNIFPSLTLWE